MKIRLNDGLTFVEARYFRDFDSRDCTEVTKMIYALYAEDPEGQSISEDKISRTFEVLTRYPEKGKIIVFEESDTLIGYMILVFFWSNEYGGNFLHIDELYVKLGYRNKGIATRSFNFVCEQYADKVVGFQLEVTPSNKEALRYYQKLGFIETANLHLIKLLKGS